MGNARPLYAAANGFLLIGHIADQLYSGRQFADRGHLIRSIPLT